LHALPTAYGSKLILVDLESRSGTDPARVVAEIRATADITHLDMVIANAGVAPKPGPLETITPKDLYDAFGINVVAPVLLYQACRQLLEMAEKPIWVTMSSAAGSVSMLEGFGIPSLFAYGASKAAVNWFTV
jgi:NAD(P)-dependent dehydrogenase (short-subunit alcohol dehydrogenase family)